MFRLNRVSYCFFFIGILGIFSNSTPEPPEKYIHEFARLFLAQDAPGILKLMHEDMVAGTDMSLTDIETMLKLYNTKQLKLNNITIEKRMKSEDGGTERVQASINFQGPVFAKKYPDPAILKMEQFWVRENSKWWLERSLSIDYTVQGKETYPTALQQETAARFEATVAILDKLSTKSKEAEELASIDPKGDAGEDYRDLEKTYQREISNKGIDPKSESVNLFLKAAAKKTGGFSVYYQGDFPLDVTDRRKPVPWQMLSEYVQAAVLRAIDYEKAGKTRNAVQIYKRILSLGCQLVNESGGLQYALWGNRYQKLAAERISKLTEGNEQKSALKIANECSRKIDLLQTALGCLNSMTDYVAQKAAILAVTREKDNLFMPWGVNTLAIYALKGAPADESTCRAAGVTVVCLNPEMQKSAMVALDSAAAEPTGKVKRFIDYQKNWIKAHNVYGGSEN